MNENKYRAKNRFSYISSGIIQHSSLQMTV